MANNIGFPSWVLGCTGILAGIILFIAIYLLIRRIRKKPEKYIEENRQFIIPDIVPPHHLEDGPEIIQPVMNPNYLNPHLYPCFNGEFEPGIPYTGPSRLCFSLHYNIMSEKLKVKLIRATRLTSKGTSALATPYVKLCLLPDKRRKINSRIHRTSNPDFNEDFVFIVPADELHTRTLKFTICDFDRFSSQQVIGHVTYPLTDVESLMTDEDVEIWMDIEAGEDTKPALPKGELLFSLQFLPTACRLNINIMKATNLQLEGELGQLYPYVKVSMVLGGKTCRKQKTSIIKRTKNPVYNESFPFTIPPDGMSRVSFIMSVINAPRLGGTKKLIGRCVVGPYMYSTGPGLAHWNDMLDSTRSAVAQWHSLV